MTNEQDDTALLTVPVDLPQFDPRGFIRPDNLADILRRFAMHHRNRDLVVRTSGRVMRDRKVWAQLITVFYYLFPDHGGFALECVHFMLRHSNGYDEVSVDGQWDFLCARLGDEPTFRSSPIAKLVGILDGSYRGWRTGVEDDNQRPIRSVAVSHPKDHPMAGQVVKTSDLTRDYNQGKGDDDDIQRGAGANRTGAAKTQGAAAIRRRVFGHRSKTKTAAAKDKIGHRFPRRGGPRNGHGRPHRAGGDG